MTPIELATIASRVAQLSTQDRGAVARVLGVLRQTDMTDPRVRVAVDIVVAVRLSDHEGDTTLDAGDAPGGALPGDMIPSSGRVRDEVWATLDPKPAASNEAGNRGPDVRMLSGSVVDWVRWLNDGMPGDATDTDRKAAVSPTHETEANR